MAHPVSWRRKFFIICALAALCLRVAPVHAQTLPPAPVIGPEPWPSLRPVDDVVKGLLGQYSIPGAVVGIVRDGRLVFIRGYGYADPASKIGVQLDSQFRVASVTKPITATAILKLVEQGTLSLDNLAFDILPPSVPVADPRIFQITVRHLLEHKGGWDRDGTGYDPMFRDQEVSVSVGKPLPIQCPDILQHMMGRMLDFDPGSKSSYSNFGYCVLDQVIEKVSGVPYGQYVRDNILKPLDMTRTQLGASAREGVAPHEVTYVDYPNAPLVPTVLDPSGTLVPIPYGGFSLEAMMANGGWISSVADLLRFASAESGARPPSVLTNPPPGFPLYVPPTDLGWGWYFNGALPGTLAVLVVDNRDTSGHRTDFCVLMNSRPQSGDVLGAMRTGILDVLKLVGVNDWPTIDLFHSRFEPSDALVELFVDGSPGSQLSKIVPVQVDGDSVPIEIQADPDAPWLHADAASFFAPTNITISAQPDTTLAVGDYYAWVTVSSPLAENRFRVRVHLRVLPSALASLALSPTSIKYHFASTGTVTLMAPARQSGGGEVVALVSSNPAVATVPSSIIVPTGTQSSTFTAFATGSVSTPTSVTITATAGGVTKQTTLTILPPVLLTSLTVPIKVVGGTSATGTVAFDVPTSVNAVVALASNSPWVAVDASVNVRAGSDRASFTIRTSNTATPVPATISATYAGVTLQATLTVMPVSVNAVTLTAYSMCAGTSLIGTSGKVSLDGPAPSGGVTVVLASSREDLARVYGSNPPRVIIPAGGISGSFMIDIRSQVLAADTHVIFSATYGGATKQATLTVVAPFLNFVSLTPTAVKGGRPSTGTAYLQCWVPHTGEVVTLSSSNPTLATVPPSVPASSASSFAITTRRVSVSTIVYFYATYRGVTKTFWLTITP